MKPMRVPPQRVRPASERPIRRDGEFVLYWMIANRRGGWNFSLERAVEWAVTLQKPLVILEALRCDYRWASDRLHAFIIEGMAANEEFFRGRPVEYYPYVEPAQGAGKGLLERLSQLACVVVTDDFPSFFLPRMVRAAADRVATRLELVDSNGLLPLRAADKVFARAFDFRRFLQQQLLPHLGELPARDPLAGVAVPVRTCIPAAVQRQWPRASGSWEQLARVGVGDLPLDHTVRPAALRGGWQAAQDVWDQFLRHKLPAYALERNQPDRNGASGLSPYLHFGHISVHQLFDDLTRQVGWTPADISRKATGSASGWWGTSEAVEGFLDELITWRELGYNMCWQREDYDQFASLPAWAQQTLADHASDPRPHVYELAEFEASLTHDPLWNATQRQLVREGRVHNYLRMLWGKKILEWSVSPREALTVMIELNNKYALDGRNPNSYSGIFWVLGRYDRPWGPERPIFGKIRYMSSENTARKVSVRDYLRAFGPET